MLNLIAVYNYAMFAMKNVTFDNYNILYQQQKQ